MMMMMVVVFQESVVISIPLTVLIISAVLLAFIIFHNKLPPPPTTTTTHSPPDDRQVSFYSHSSSTGEFDRLPVDVFIHILKFLGPKDAARLAAVCKSWKYIISDDRLWIYFLQNHKEPWDSIFFAETHLRAGYRLQRFYSEPPQLSFKQIYGQRVQVPGAVIIDGGSGYCKFGWSKYASPSGRSATFMEFGNIESPMYSRLPHFYATIFSRMQVKPSAQPVVVSVPLCHYDDTESARASRRQLKEAICSTLFDLNVPAVCAINQATLALYAARRSSGIAVNIGFHATSVVPILRGKVMRNVGVEVMEMGGLKLTGYLKELMQQNNINCDSLYTVRTLKENLCYVALDYKEELSKDTMASCRIGGEIRHTLRKERFQTGEALFQPRLAGENTIGLHQAVALCMERAHAAYLTDDDAWFKTIVLTGGSACFPGLAERLEKELFKLVPSLSNGIRVLPPPYGADSAWYGARLVSNVRNNSNLAKIALL
uniref:F-box domain-containing protein n=1 Tax=Kalanchoe fedtschenkoi TaxID=63787 RepID=A0A7N0VMV8_KALFE